MSNTTYFRINTDLDSYKKTENYKRIKSPFHYWLRDGYAYATPDNDTKYRDNLKKLRPGSIMFAYESEFGFVAAGTVQEAWDGKSYEGGSDLYPKLNENEKSIKFAFHGIQAFSAY